MTPVIGIDLGTTNTVVAVVRDGQAAAIPDETGRTLLPSVVSFHPSGNVLVGRDARERRLVDSANTIYSVKRLIGRSWDSEEVQRARTRFAFSMREGPGQAALVVGRGETYTLPEISAFVLRRAKQVAEAALGERVERAVITVPANFNDLQRAATKVAGRVAGLEVLRILNEPTAAALAYGFGKSTAERIAVYDFGGGTFDVTLLDLSDNVFEVLATAGNTFLGGDDIDLLIAERMATQFLSRHRYDPRSDPQVFERLRAAAEDVKQRLSAEPEVTIELSDVGHGPAGKALHLEFRMTRLELESLITPLVDRTFDVCREALGLARRVARDFDQVLLVGGSTRVPLVRRRVEEFFGREVKASVNPDEVVALGAAIQANALTLAERRRKTLPPLPAAAVARRSVPTAARARHDSAPGAEPPSTQGFGDKPRAALGSEPLEVLGSAPQPRPDAALGVLGRPADKPRLGTATLDGLGARGKVRTGAGLGLPTSETIDPKSFADPEIADLPQVASTLLSQADAARRAQQTGAQKDSASSRLQEPDADETTRSMPGKGKTREESAAFALGEADLEYLAEKSSHSWQKPSSSSSRSIDRTLFAAEEDEPTNARGSKPDFSVEDLEIPKPVPALGGTLPLTPAAARKAPLSGFGQITDPTLAAPPAQPLAQAAPPPVAPPPPLAVPSATRTAVMPVVTAPIAFPSAAPTPTETVSAPPPAAPLLVDVTPLTLSVETVSGYCDPIIDRNTPIPCAESRAFVTASDGQTVVRVRVAQGESKRFDNNTLLGEVELPGLPAAPRGAVQISVTFALDASGMLNVSATELASGRATRAVLRLVGLPGPSEIAQMMDRQHQRIA